LSKEPNCVYSITIDGNDCLRYFNTERVNWTQQHTREAAKQLESPLLAAHFHA